MTRLEHLLNSLMEEAAEVIQRASKAKRFGLSEIEPGQSLSNAERLIGEFADLLVVMQMTVEEGWGSRTNIDDLVTNEMILNKIVKVKEYLAYSKTCGTLED